MEVKEILRQLPSLEGLTFDYQGETFNVPYSTITINGETFLGLRENVKRAALFDSILDELNIERDGYLDIGSNLGYFVNHFSGTFKYACGIEKDLQYLRLVSQIWNLPGSPVKLFYQADMNFQKPYFLKQFSFVTALSMIEYIDDKPGFVEYLHQITKDVCIVEGHSEDIKKGLDKEYEALLKRMPWSVRRLEVLTDPGLNAPQNSVGRPVWVCTK